MISEFMKKEIDNLIANDIRFRPIGRWEELPQQVVKDINEGIQRTSAGEKMLFQVALNYGGRMEILDAFRKLAAKCLQGELRPEAIEVDTISAHLYSPGVPDPDLLIRTSGEFRISNFLLWELAYTEIYVTKVLWPDFKLRNLLEALVDFQNRERRYGGLNKEKE